MEELTQIMEKIRLNLGLSKRELAIKADISEEYYWRIVTGQAPGVAFNIVERLCKALNISISFSLQFTALDAIPKPVKRVRKKPEQPGRPAYLKGLSLRSDFDPSKTSY